MGGDIGRYAAVTRSHSLHNLHTTPHKYWGVEVDVGDTHKRREGPPKALTH